MKFPNIKTGVVLTKLTVTQQVKSSGNKETWAGSVLIPATEKVCKEEERRLGNEEKGEYLF